MFAEYQLKTKGDLEKIAREYRYRDVREVARLALRLLAERDERRAAPPKKHEGPAGWK